MHHPQRFLQLQKHISTIFDGTMHAQEKKKLKCLFNHLMSKYHCRVLAMSTQRVIRATIKDSEVD
jgi:hypothetical protein